MYKCCALFQIPDIFDKIFQQKSLKCCILQTKGTSATCSSPSNSCIMANGEKKFWQQQACHDKRTLGQGRLLLSFVFRKLDFFFHLVKEQELKLSFYIMPTQKFIGWKCFCWQLRLGKDLQKLSTCCMIVSLQACRPTFFLKKIFLLLE